MKRFFEKIVETILMASGAVTSLTIILIVVFLFKEASGLFSEPTVERGFSLVVNSENRVDKLTEMQIKDIFDGKITSWVELGGANAEILVFRFNDITSYATEEELGDSLQFIPQAISRIIAENGNIIAFLPNQYLLTSHPLSDKGRVTSDPLSDKGRVTSDPSSKSLVTRHSSLAEGGHLSLAEGGHLSPPYKVMDCGTITPADFFGGDEWFPTAQPAPLFGLMPLLMGTLWVSLFAILLALPLGLAVAIYLAELASPKIRAVLKPVIELLAGIPSVVYGFFGLIVLVPLIRTAFNLPVGETALAGSVILAIMALPTIITVAQDAITSVPRSAREASLALGASHLQTISRVVLPYSISGIMAAVVLGIGRAIGETMAVLMVTGNAAVIPHTLLEPVRTIPATIAAELGEAPGGGAHYQALFMLGCILFLITLIVSITAEIFSQKKYNTQ